jgi:hypothetical protein
MRKGGAKKTYEKFEFLHCQSICKLSSIKEAVLRSLKHIRSGQPADVSHHAVYSVGKYYTMFKQN